MTIQVVAILTIKDRDLFVEFETAAVGIIREYGGELRSAFEPEGGAERSSQEVHLLEFPDRASLQNYQCDTRLQELAGLRARAISHSDVYVSGRTVVY